MAGFEAYLKTKTITWTITRTYTPSYRLVIANGVEYHMFDSGKVYNKDGLFITASGVAGLRKYILELL
jgi:hypothetical protein